MRGLLGVRLPRRDVRLAGRPLLHRRQHLVRARLLRRVPGRHCSRRCVHGPLFFFAVRPSPADARVAAARRFYLSCLPRRRRQLRPRDGPALVRRRLLLELFFTSGPDAVLVLQRPPPRYRYVDLRRFVSPSGRQGQLGHLRDGCVHDLLVALGPAVADPVRPCAQLARASRAAASRSCFAAQTVRSCVGRRTLSRPAAQSASRRSSASTTRRSRSLNTGPAGGVPTTSTGRASSVPRSASATPTRLAASTEPYSLPPSCLLCAPSSPLSSPFSLCRSQGILSTGMRTVRVQGCARISRHGRSERSRALRKAIGSRVAARTAIVPLRRSRAAKIRRSLSPRPLKLCSRAALVALMRIVSATRKLGASPGKRAPAVLAPQLFLSLALALPQASIYRYRRTLPAASRRENDVPLLHPVCRRARNARRRRIRSADLLPSSTLPERRCVPLVHASLGGRS